LTKNNINIDITSSDEHLLQIEKYTRPVNKRVRSTLEHIAFEIAPGTMRELTSTSGSTHS